MVAEADQEVTTLWNAFGASQDATAREHLIARYGGLARRIAIKLYSTRMDDSVPFDDYLQYARVGLIEAIDRYEPGRGASFETFSTHRIRGAVLNGLVHETELKASRSKRQRRLAEREESLAGEVIARPENAALEDFVRLSVGLAVGLILDEGVEGVADESAHANPYSQVETVQLHARVRQLVEQLPARERQVMQCHYYEQREFQEIGAALGISKGRVSQLHARALARIHEALNARPKIDRSL